MRHEMHILDQSGHLTIKWDRNNADEVENAEGMFDDMVEKGFNAFRVEGADNQGSRLTKFDPAAERIMMVPQLRGG